MPSVGDSTQMAQSVSQSTQKKDLIQAVAFILGGGAAAVTVYLTWKTLQTTLWSSRQSVEAASRNIALTHASLEETRKTVRLTQQAQSADRFTKAIDQLGNDKPEVRLGGIYALGAIDRENQEYQEQVVEVLSAYIRTNYPRASITNTASTLAQMPGRQGLFAIVVIFRRILSNLPPKQDVEETYLIYHIDLSNTNLRKANLASTNLEGADLTYSILEDANLQGANLSNADLNRAVLWQASLIRANVFQARFSEADLRYANLAHIENWRQIESLNKSNIWGIENPPAGFVAWATEENGAVAIESTTQWRDEIRWS